MKQLDFLAIGDTAIDDFIRLKEAEVHCDVNTENCTICMRFGDKIPFESSTIVYGVGNAANAAVSASRLGLNSALIAGLGKDDRGAKILEHFKEERVSTDYIGVHEGIPTNYHYVLWYGDERTILIKHNDYPRVFPKDMPAPKAIYLTSLGEVPEKYYSDIADYLEAHPEIFLTFQPGTFQMKIGVEKLKRFYARANLLVLNKEEASRVLSDTTSDVKTLAEKLHALGSNMVAITDGREGLDIREEDGEFYHLSMFPDPKPPLQRTGAGDAFASTTTAYLIQGMSLKDAALRGTVNSAYVVQNIGAQKGLLTKEELEAKL